MDRGDSTPGFPVLYLGQNILSQFSTGLGVLQKPLRDLYYPHRQGKKGHEGQERILDISPRGLTMKYRETPTAYPKEQFFEMSSVLFWDAVQFVAVRGSKKVMCAFEPLDNDFSRNKDNLFQPLDKKFTFLQQLQHPPLLVNSTD